MDLTQFARTTEKAGILGLVITQNGEEIARTLWDEECRRNIYSASKSFTSCAVGIAIREGLLSLEEKLTDVFEKKLPDKVDEHLEKAVVRDLLTMSLGQAKPQMMGAQRPLYDEDDWVKMSLAFPFSSDPGKEFLYSNVGPYLAGMLVQQRAGCDLVSYLMPRLFQHLGIGRPTWETDPLGNTFGAGGLYLTMSELHKFGLLYLQEGNWNGKQLVPIEWVKESTKPQADKQYGYLFWCGPHNTYRADGKYQQLSIIAPEKNAVITTVAECHNGSAILDAVFEELYPQL